MRMAWGWAHSLWARPVKGSLLSHGSHRPRSRAGAPLLRRLGNAPPQWHCNNCRSPRELSSFTRKRWFSIPGVPATRTGPTPVPVLPSCSPQTARCRCADPGPDAESPGAPSPHWPARETPCLRPTLPLPKPGGASVVRACSSPPSATVPQPRRRVVPHPDTASTGFFQLEQSVRALHPDGLAQVRLGVQAVSAQRPLPLNADL